MFLLVPWCPVKTMWRRPMGVNKLKRRQQELLLREEAMWLQSHIFEIVDVQEASAWEKRTEKCQLKASHSGIGDQLRIQFECSHVCRHFKTITFFNSGLNTKLRKEVWTMLVGQERDLSKNVLIQRLPNECFDDYVMIRINSPIMTINQERTLRLCKCCAFMRDSICLLYDDYKHPICNINSNFMRKVHCCNLFLTPIK